jgi:CobQ-like glutamine amidotransferase family enzyme
VSHTKPTDSTVRIAHLYPELLGTYGDSGNARVLRQRLRWRGLGCEILSVRLGHPIPRSCDLVLLGGGEDDAQAAAAAGVRGSLGAAVDAGTVVFGVCAGLQLLGDSFRTWDGRQIAGAAVADLTSTRLRRAAIGEVTAQPLDPDIPMMTGFTNHRGASHLGPDAAPLAEVLRGPGNHNRTTAEGVVQGRVIGTYLHGPVLARNPALADWLLALATGLTFPALTNDLATTLNEERLAAKRPRRQRGLFRLS